MANDGVSRIQLPDKAKFLLTERRRWKVLWGGRDACKSHSVFRAALVRGIQGPTRFLVARELQDSIDNSAHTLLRDLINTLGLDWAYDVQRSKIIGKGDAQGTSFGFEGLRHNVDELKSYEGVDVCIVEEANNVSRHSWDTLENTIRKPDSEIWVTFNPELETDETYIRFIARELPADEAIVVHMTWRDNPWPSEVLRSGRERMRLERPADYDCIWEGQPRNTLAEAIYADEMMTAQREGRICRVPYDPSAAVHTFWDLGWGNHTSIWVGQKVGVEWRMLKFIENSNKFLPYYVAELQRLPYVWGTDYLPHDGSSKHVQGDSAEQQLIKAGRTVECLTNDAIDTGINAVRAVFPSVYFDRDGCADGIQALRHYRWKKTNTGIVVSREPLHDEFSDAADAFRTFGMARNRPTKKQIKQAPRQRPSYAVPAAGVGSWMAG